jgi:hypothetical protein
MIAPTPASGWRLRDGRSEGGKRCEVVIALSVGARVLLSGVDPSGILYIRDGCKIILSPAVIDGVLRGQTSSS